MADKFSTPFKALAGTNTTTPPLQLCHLPLLTPVVNTATTDGPGCPQVCTLPPGGCPPIMSEDCLLMNIYTPLGASAGDNLPVMIFIHGGQVRSRLHT